MKKLTKNNAAALILFVIIVLSTAVITVHGMTTGEGTGQDIEDMSGIGYLKAFTNDSNILMGIFALISAAFIILKGKLPRRVLVMDLIGATAVGVTLLVVVFVLVPPMYFGKGIPLPTMFRGGLFHFHFANPIMAGAALILSAEDTKFTLRERLLALSPVFVYSFVYLTMVIFVKRWADFYDFTLGGKTFMIPVSFVMIYSISIGTTALLSFLCGKKSLTKAEKESKI